MILIELLLNYIKISNVDFASSVIILNLEMINFVILSREEV